MKTKIKHSLLSVGVTGLLSLGTLAVASPSYAASIDLSSWTAIGDASTSATTATIESGTNTVETDGGNGSLQQFLGITVADLDNAIPNNTFGSVIKNTLGASGN